MRSTPRLLRLPIGPSPWAFINRSCDTAEGNLRFSETSPKDSKLAGLTSLHDSTGTTLLILDFYWYVRILDGGRVFVWREEGDDGSKRIVFKSFELCSLQPVPDPLTVAAHLRANKLGISPLCSSQHWEFSARLEPGTYPITVPHDWSCFEETLVMADHADSNHYDRMSRAIFSFDWCRRIVEVYPQDWFNKGNYDFGYQWVSRVARQTDGSIVGEGIRLGAFVLDKSYRNVKKWLRRNPFQMISDETGGT